MGGQPAGIETAGDEVGSVTDSQGIVHTIKFSRPTSVSVYVAMELTTDPAEFPADGDDQAKAAIVAYFEELEIGDDVVVYPKLISTINDIPGITDVRIGVSTVTNPPNLTGSDSNITVAASAVATIANELTDITVTVI